VNRRTLFLATWVGRGIFKGAALICALILIAALWWWDAALLTRAADENLNLIKSVTALLPADWASKTESALRLFGADRALLLTEAIVLTKLALLAVAYPFRGARRRDTWQT
jgi:hypothetical protein